MNYAYKKTKHSSLEPEEKAFNQRLAQCQVKVKQRIRKLKVFRILKGVYRGRQQRFELNSRTR